MPTEKMHGQSSMGLVIALIVLCAVGFLILFFRIDTATGQETAAIANVSSQVNTLNARLATDEEMLQGNQGQMPTPMPPTNMPMIPAGSGASSGDSGSVAPTPAPEPGGPSGAMLIKGGQYPTSTPGQPYNY